MLLGASGDLAGRLLLPALGQLLDAEEARRSISLIGAGTEDWDQKTWQDRVRSSFESGKVSQETVDAVLATTKYEKADVTNVDDLKRLLDAGPPAPALYFALPPAVTVLACTALQEVALPKGTTLVLEKPFGTNAESAASLNDLLTDLVPEAQIHRVDHFLGRATVLNLLGVRFANHLFEPLWNRDHIDHVDIVFDEQLTLEGRARYYDSAGALMDMIQSHLLQILAWSPWSPSPASTRWTYARPRRAYCDPAECGTTTRSRPASGPATRVARSRDVRFRTTPPSRASIRSATPRRWPN